MRTTEEFVQGENGRWEWVIFAVQDDLTRGKLAISVISFPSRLDAQTDLQQHVTAPLDESGRGIRSKEEIRELIRLAATACDDCNDAYFGGVYWHERDASGCNWSISTINGQDWAGCMDCMRPAATRLRETYNIADEG